MKFGKPLLGSAFIAAGLLAQACVEYIPENGPPAAAQPPPSPPQYPGSPSAPPAPPLAPPPAQPGDTRLDALLAPIALYPDPLIAIILPASTMPSEISAASGYLIQYGDASQIDSQPWDPSVRALAHYPTVITWMADNMAWTQALGDAFSSSPSDVMASIQRLRSRALASGALAPSPQEQVYTEDDEIEIDPALEGAIYVPTYDPDAVYADGPYGGPPMGFGPAYPSGTWLSYSVDWRSRAVWVAGPNAQRAPGGWYHPQYHGGHAPPDAATWHPGSGRPQGQQPVRAPGANPVPRPHPMPTPASSGAPVTRVSNAASGQQRSSPAQERAAPGAAPTEHMSPSEGSRTSAPPARPEPSHPAPAHAEPSHPESSHPAPAASSDSKDHDQGK